MDNTTNKESGTLDFTVAARDLASSTPEQPQEGSGTGFVVSPSMKHAIRVLGHSRDNLITGNILGGATEKLLDASGEPSELRDNLLLRQVI